MKKQMPRGVFIFMNDGMPRYMRGAARPEMFACYFFTMPRERYSEARRGRLISPYREIYVRHAPRSMISAR